MTIRRTEEKAHELTVLYEETKSLAQRVLDMTKTKNDMMRELENKKAEVYAHVDEAYRKIDEIHMTMKAEQAYSNKLFASLRSQGNQ